MISALSQVNRSSLRYRAFFGLGLFVSISVLFRMYLQLFNWGYGTSVRLNELVDGTGRLPFVTRRLVPLLIGSLASLLQIPLELVASGVMFVSLAAFVAAFRYFITAFRSPSVLTDSLTWLGLVGLCPFMVAFSSAVYDFTTLFLFTLELALMARQKWRWYFCVFPFACANRETTILLCLTFCLYFFKRMERRSFVRLLAAQGAIYLSIRGWLLLQFRNNPGGLLEWHLPEQIHVLGLLAASLIRLSPTAILAASFLLAGFVILFLTFYRWQAKPPFLRDALVTTLPPLLVLYIPFGIPFEIRVFYEVYPVIFLLSIEPLIWRLGFAPEPAPVRSPTPADREMNLAEHQHA